MITTLLVPLLASATASPVPSATPATSVASFAQVEQPEIPTCEGEKIKLESGVEYCVLKTGSGGPKPLDGDLVKVDYTGWTLDGKSFDSSRKPRDPRLPAYPAEFAIGAVIEGWNEALQLMSPGDHWLVTIPSALAYGERGNAGIPPNSDLIFEIELHGIVQTAVQPQPWDAEAEGIVKLDSGVEYRVLKEGSGQNATETVVFAEFTIALPIDNVLQRSTFSPRTNLGVPIGPDQQPLPFMKDLLPVLSKGALVQVSVPRDQGATKGRSIEAAKEGDRELWMLGCNFVFPKADAYETTESGLKYIMLREGTGKNPTADDKVIAHYRGLLASNGSMFDASYNKGVPLLFGLDQVVQGWIEGIPLIKEGGKALLYVPSELGYGQSPKPGIPAGSDLIFIIDLLEVRQPPATDGAATGDASKGDDR